MISGFRAVLATQYDAPTFRHYGAMSPSSVEILKRIVIHEDILEIGNCAHIVLQISKGGHRVKGIELTEQALAQVREGHRVRQ
jgi:hypothetical protein